MYSQVAYSERAQLEKWRRLPGVTALLHSSPKPPKCNMHKHSESRISFIIRGESVEVNDVGKMVEAGPTTLVFTPAEMMHAHVIKTDTISLCADFTEQFILDAQCGALLDSPSIFKSGPVITTMLRIQREVLSSDQASDLILQGLFLELLGEMSRTKARKHPAGAPSWLPRALSLLRDRALESFSIEEVSREIGVDPSHLARVFRTCLNETPGGFVRKQRLSWAAREIVRTDKPMNLIAAEAGYSDQAHFNKHFKSQIGLTPTDFRRTTKL